MNSESQTPVADEQTVAPVTILDGAGRVVKILPAEEFRRIHGFPEPPKIENLRRRRGRVKAAAPETALTPVA